jgi:UDP-N-acetylmuramate: L-alanyl-gamma-D-glutamyl-meso-diaminopimelate ligase
MRIHILGICGTFMGSLAVLAKQLGHEVSGSDQSVYPPMSTQLEAQGIALCQGYDPAHITANNPDVVVIGTTWQSFGGVRAGARPAVCLGPGLAG